MGHAGMWLHFSVGAAGQGPPPSPPAVLQTGLGQRGVSSLLLRLMGKQIDVPHSLKASLLPLQPHLM